MKDGARRDGGGYGTGQTGSKSDLGEKLTDYKCPCREARVRHSEIDAALSANGTVQWLRPVRIRRQLLQSQANAAAAAGDR